MNHELLEITDWVEAARAAKYQPQSLAKLCHCSLRQLELHFDRCCCQPPKRWLLEVKLWEAARFMVEGQDPKMACQNAGFQDLSHFNRKFKEYHGCTPMEFIATFRQREFNERDQAEQMASMEKVRDVAEFDIPFHARALEILSRLPRWRPAAR
jgi:AraC-like DNA-binding protein